MNNKPPSSLAPNPDDHHFIAGGAVLLALALFCLEQGASLPAALLFVGVASVIAWLLVAIWRD